MMRTGQAKAAERSKPTHPEPRLPGSELGPCGPTRPGYPIETASYSQPLDSLRTPSTICPGVSVFPEGILRGSVCPAARILTFEPPISTERIRFGDHWSTVLLSSPG